MSMRTYGLSDVGLVIADEVAILINVHVAMLDGTIEPDVKRAVEDGSLVRDMNEGRIFDAMSRGDATIVDDYLDADAAFDFLQNDMNLPEARFCTEFDGEAETAKLGWAEAPMCRTWEWTGVSMSYLALERQSGPIGQAYAGPEEVEQELRGKLSDVVPAGFDIRPFIVSVEGTYFC